VNGVPILFYARQPSQPKSKPRKAKAPVPKADQYPELIEALQALGLADVTAVALDNRPAAHFIEGAVVNPHASPEDARQSASLQHGGSEATARAVTRGRFGAASTSLALNRRCSCRSQPVEPSSKQLLP
jgi:hypothetical protein